MKHFLKPGQWSETILLATQRLIEQPWEQNQNLDFVVDTPTTPVQEEGVVGVEGLVLVDDDFIQNCLAVITEVSECISKQRPDFLD